MVIVFHSVVLQNSEGFNNFAQISKCILFLLDFLNRGALDELMKYTYNSAMSYLGKAPGIQTEKQRH